MSTGTPLQFQECNGPGTVQKHRRVLAALDSEDYKSGFCCPIHREMLEDELDSENEVTVIRPVKKGGKVAFVADGLFQAKNHLTQANNKNESSSSYGIDIQANLMAELANRPLRLLHDRTKMIPQTEKCPLASAQIGRTPVKSTQQVHAPQYVADAETEERPVVCPTCNARFATGQALGGHTSRRHSKFVREKRPRSEQSDKS